MSPRVLAVASALVGAGAVSGTVASGGCSTSTCDETDTCAADLDAASDASTAPRRGFCAQRADAAFCADFDGVELGLTDTYTENDAQIFVALDDGAPSPPNALHMLLPPVAGDASSLANYVAYDAGSPTYLHLSFAMRVEYAPPGGGAAVTGFIRGGGAYQIYFNVDPQAPAGLSLVEQGSEYVAHPFVGTLPDLTQWHHYDLVISYQAGQTFSLSIDDAGAQTGTLHVGWDPTQVSLVPSAGVSNRPATGPQHFHFDDIVLYTAP